MSDTFKAASAAQSRTRHPIGRPRRKLRPAHRIHSRGPVRQHGLFRLRVLRLAGPHADHRPARRRRPALHGLSYHGHVLDDPFRNADGSQSAFGRRRQPRQLRQWLSRLSRQDPGRPARCRDAAPSRLAQLHGGQVARDPAHESWLDWAVRRLAARPRFDRYYGFMDAETDQYAPELVLDNSRDRSAGYLQVRLSPHEPTSSIRSIRFLAGHIAEKPDSPGCSGSHSGPPMPRIKRHVRLSSAMTRYFAGGWDVERERRLARQLEMGIVPPARACRLATTAYSPGTAFTRGAPFFRLQAAFAGMLDHADRQLARLSTSLNAAGQRDNTIILVLSDNGASQEGGLLGGVTLGPRNMRPELWPEKMARLEDIGGPKAHNNFPHGWAMASNTPLRRYKQNTHGGGIRDPFIVSWPRGIRARGELRHQFATSATSCRRCSTSLASSRRPRSTAWHRCRSRA